MALLDRFDRWLTQYLDSLPKSDRPDIGAGYTMAAAAAVAAIIFGIGQGILSGVGAGALFFGVGTDINPLVIGGVAVMAAVSWLTAAGASLAVVIPGGFVGGVVVWRFVPESLRLGGFIGGLLSTLVGYVVSCAILLPLGVVFSIAVDPSMATATDSMVTFVLLLGFIAVYTSWATVPVGVLTGYLFERSLD
jgi:hypothetical protein